MWIKSYPNELVNLKNANYIYVTKNNVIKANFNIDAPDSDIVIQYCRSNDAAFDFIFDLYEEKLSCKNN